MPFGRENGRKLSKYFFPFWFDNAVGPAYPTYSIGQTSKVFPIIAVELVYRRLGKQQGLNQFRNREMRSAGLLLKEPEQMYVEVCHVPHFSPLRRTHNVT